MTSEASVVDWLAAQQALLRLAFALAVAFNGSFHPYASRTFSVIANTEVNVVVFLQTGR